MKKFSEFWILFNSRSLCDEQQPVCENQASLCSFLYFTTLAAVCSTFFITTEAVLHPSGNCVCCYPHFSTITPPLFAVPHVVMIKGQFVAMCVECVLAAGSFSVAPCMRMTCACGKNPEVCVCAWALGRPQWISPPAVRQPLKCSPVALQGAASHGHILVSAATTWLCLPGAPKARVVTVTDTEWYKAGEERGNEGAIRRRRRQLWKNKRRMAGRRREKTEITMSHNSHLLFHCQLENKENIELVDIPAWS